MNKKVVFVHRILLGSGSLALLASLAFFLIRWSALPAEPGIHFAPDGSFDVYANKAYGFYPHIVGGIMTAGMALAGGLIRRKPTGLRITERGEALFRAELILTLDVIAVLIGGFFAYWSWCVSVQQPLHPEVARGVILTILLAAAAGILAEVVTVRLHRVQTTEKKPPNRRLPTMAAWLLYVGNALVLLEAWERIPGEEDVKHAGQVFAANLDTYLDKRVLLIPLIVEVLLLTVLEVVTERAVKKDDQALVRLTGDLKLWVGLFCFWWNLLLCLQQKIGAVSVCACLVLCGISVFRFIRNKKVTENQ